MFKVYVKLSFIFKILNQLAYISWNYHLFTSVISKIGDWSLGMTSVTFEQEHETLRLSLNHLPPMTQTQWLMLF